MAEEMDGRAAQEADDSSRQKKGFFGKLFGSPKKPEPPPAPATAPAQAEVVQAEVVSDQAEESAESYAESEAEAPASAAPTAPAPPRTDRAEVPTAVLTVEYLESGPAVDQSLKEIERRLTRLEALVSAITDSQKTALTGMVKNVEQIAKTVESVSRRLDRVWRRMDMGSISSSSEEALVEEEKQEAELPDVAGPPQEFQNDPDHVRAMRIAKVMASDLEAYNGAQVKEAALYGNLEELLGQQLEDARLAYSERVPERVREQFDYFQLALNEMLVRNRSQG
ncbi:MAG TPA: hypothetical protein PL033_19500 [Candidatus Brocadiia bacterium]|nr:hypothetical protein [Candidatus Brocadiia bacterium]